MDLSPMRYKDYVWPHNPKVYTIDYERQMAVDKVPFGLYHLQDLGRTRRVMRGEGEFVGKDAYAQFGALANVFYKEGAGPLIHPLWQAANAYFVELTLKQEPRPDYVSYSFTFWEELDVYDGKLKLEEKRESGQTESVDRVIHKVVKGDTLWAIAKRYGVTMEQLLKRNPDIKNPNLIRVGQEVVVK
ncbi:MAG: LysM peptidoglycan-binding domain-containing protein [Oscillospiraceae bacterium]|nr:LysM peptidoglycan-binding domain-containing protein [Oscillospiraceae bacterium]